MKKKKEKECVSLFESRVSNRVHSIIFTSLYNLEGCKKESYVLSFIVLCVSSFSRVFLGNRRLNKVLLYFAIHVFCILSKMTSERRLVCCWLVDWGWSLAHTYIQKCNGHHAIVTNNPRKLCRWLPVFFSPTLTTFTLLTYTSTTTTTTH